MQKLLLITPGISEHVSRIISLGIILIGLFLNATVIFSKEEPGANSCADCGRITLKSEIFRNETFRTRLWLRFPAYSLTCLGIAAFTSEGPVYRMAGLETPVFCLGPVSLEGLLKEVTNPLGYQADSSIYTQSPRLKLNGAFLTKERLGLVLGPVSFIPAFFILTKKVAALNESLQPDRWGCFLPWSLSESFALDFLLTNTTGEATAHSNQPTTLAIKSRFKQHVRDSSFASALTMAVSEGTTPSPGYFCTLQAVLETPWLKADGLWGIASPHYHPLPDVTAEIWQKAEFSSSWRLFKCLWLGAGYKRQVDFSARTERADYLPTKECFKLLGELCLPVTFDSHKPPAEIFARCEIKNEQVYASDGSLSEKKEFHSDLKYSLPSVRCALEYSYKQNDKSEHRLQGSLAYRVDYSSSSLELALALDQKFVKQEPVIPATIELAGNINFNSKQDIPSPAALTNHLKRHAAKNSYNFYIKIKHQFIKAGTDTTWPLYQFNDQTYTSEFLLTLGWEVHGGIP